MTSTLEMMPVLEGVALLNVFQQIANGKLTANEFNTQGAASMLNEMHKWAEALKPLRDGVRAA